MAGYSYSTTGKNIAQIHKEMKRMPDELLDEISRQNDAYSSLALTELKDRNTQKAMQQAMQPPAPTVADNVRNESANRGIESLALAEQNFREGGIIGYANTGLVLGEDDYRDFLMAGFDPNTLMQDELPRDFMSTGLAYDPMTSEFDQAGLLAAGPTAEEQTKGLGGFTIKLASEDNLNKTFEDMKPTETRDFGEERKEAEGGNPFLARLKREGEFGKQNVADEIARMKEAEKEAGYDPDLYKENLKALEAEKEGYAGARKRAGSQVLLDLAAGVVDPEMTQKGVSTLGRLVKSASPAFKSYSQELDDIDSAKRIIDKEVRGIKTAQNQLKQGRASDARKTVDANKKEYRTALINAYDKEIDRLMTQEEGALTRENAMKIARGNIAAELYIADIATKTDLAKIHANGIADILSKSATGTITNEDIYGYLEELQGMADVHKRPYVEPFLMEASPEKLKSLKTQFVKMDSGAASLFEQAINGNKEKSTKARQELYKRLQFNVAMQNLALSYSAKRMADSVESLQGNMGEINARIRKFDEIIGPYSSGFKKGGLVGLASY